MDALPPKRTLDGADPGKRLMQDLSDMVDRLELAIAAAAAPVRDAALERAVRQGISAHASAAVRAMQWRNVLVGVVIVMAAFGLGYAVCWRMTPQLTCQDQRGGVLCYTWSVSPTQAEPAETAAPKPTKNGGRQ